MIEPFELERLFAKHEFTAKYLLSSSDAETCTVRELLALEPSATEQLLQFRLGYTDSRGDPELRAEIARQYSGWVSAEDILIHVGAQEPIHNLLRSILSPGDHVIAHSPGYQSIYSIPRDIGCSIDLWQSSHDRGWELDLEQFKKMLRPQTKLVMVNFPQNPTGFVPSLSWFSEFIQVIRERGIRLLSDEVYRGLELDSSRRLPAAVEVYEKAVSVGVLSKAHGLAGLRLGWIATQDQSVYSALAQYKDYTTICNPGVTEVLGRVAVRHQEVLFERNRNLVLKNLHLVEECLSRYPGEFQWVAPTGGTMMFPKSVGRINIPELAEELLSSFGVMLISGSFFRMHENYFRLGLGRDDFSSGFSFFQKVLSNKRGT